MNSKGHLLISLAKSAIRLISGVISIITVSVLPLAVGVVTAEILGIAEELVDKR